MRSTLCFVMIAALGCGARTPRRTMRYSELTIAGALVGVLASSLAMAALPDHKDAVIPVIIGFGVVGLASFGVYFSAVLADETVAGPPPQPPNTVAAQRADEDAWGLTKRAAAAARARDCKTALQLSPKVKALDADFHAKVFSRDVAIARCLH